MEYQNSNRSVHVYMYSYLFAIIIICYILLPIYSTSCLYQWCTCNIFAYICTNFCNTRAVKLIFMRTLEVVRNCSRTTYIWLYNEIWLNKIKNAHIFEFLKTFYIIEITPPPHTHTRMVNEEEIYCTNTYFFFFFLIIEHWI